MKYRIKFIIAMSVCITLITLFLTVTVNATH